MAKEQQFVFVEEGGAGRAFVAKHDSQKLAEENVSGSIGNEKGYRV